MRQRQVILVSVLSCLLLVSVVSAVWWNPATWFAQDVRLSPGTTPDLINVDFGASAGAVLGAAAFGSAGDYWNKDSGVLKYADGSTSSLNLTHNLRGVWGGSFSVPTGMMNSYRYSGTSLTLSGVPSGIYDVYLYGHGDRPDQAGVFTLAGQGMKQTTSEDTAYEADCADFNGDISSCQSYVDQGMCEYHDDDSSCSGTYHVPSYVFTTTSWEEGIHYVVYRALPLSSGSLTVQVGSYINGLQLVKLPSSSGSSGTAPAQTLTAVVPANASFRLSSNQTASVSLFALTNASASSFLSLCASSSVYPSYSASLFCSLLPPGTYTADVRASGFNPLSVSLSVVNHQLLLRNVTLVPYSFGPTSTPPTCTSYTYSAWSACENGVETRWNLSVGPAGCVGGTPLLTRECTLTPENCESYSDVTSCSDAGCIPSGDYYCGDFNDASSCAEHIGCSATITGCEEFSGADIGYCETDHAGCWWNPNENSCNGEMMHACAGDYLPFQCTAPDVTPPPIGDPVDTLLVSSGPVSCTTGCLLGERCVAVGYRVSNVTTKNYCSLDATFVPQKRGTQETPTSCDNNFECVSNSCSAGQCVESDQLLQEQRNIRSLLIRALCRITNLFDNEQYGSCLDSYLTDVSGVYLCTDTDGGDVLGTVGTYTESRVVGTAPPLVTNTGSDRCVSTDFVLEGFCSANRSVMHTQFCQNGCVNGACVGTAPVRSYAVQMQKGVMQYLALPLTLSSSNISVVLPVQTVGAGSTAYLFRNNSWTTLTARSTGWTNSVALLPGEVVSLKPALNASDMNRTLTLSGTALVRMNALRITGNVSLIGLGYVPSGMQARALLDELQRYDSRCYAIGEAVVSGTPRYLSDAPLAFNGTAGNFALRADQAYWVWCSSATSFVTQPTPVAVPNFVLYDVLPNGAGCTFLDDASVSCSVRQRFEYRKAITNEGAEVTVQTVSGSAPLLREYLYSRASRYMALGTQGLFLTDETDASQRSISWITQARGDKTMLVSVRLFTHAQATNGTTYTYTTSEGAYTPFLSAYLRAYPPVTW